MFIKKIVPCEVCGSEKNTKVEHFVKVMPDGSINNTRENLIVLCQQCRKKYANNLYQARRDARFMHGDDMYPSIAMKYLVDSGTVQYHGEYV